MAHLTIIRGLPGSGKSTFAKRMGCAHFEADMWMVDDEGAYAFDAGRLGFCHSECLKAVKDSLESGNDVVVSNTFTRIWEMQPYIDLGHPYTVIMMLGDYQNVHGVPKETIDHMRGRWEF